MRPTNSPDRLRLDHQQRAITTWQYLRLAIVVLVVGLGVSVGYERWKVPGDCFQTSISAYYYTPAHGYFVAALLAIGVSLFCLKGSTEAEDGLLNLAGMFSPIVALVPTPGYDQECTSAAGLTQDLGAGVANNVTALIVVGSLAFAVILAMTLRKLGDLPRTARRWYGVAAVVWVAFAVVFFADRKFFVDVGHYSAAIPMFVCIVLVVFVNAWGYKRKTEAATARNRYAAVGIAMIGCSLLAVVAWRVHWSHTVIAIEGALIFLFAFFWVIQTFELRDEGLRES